MENRFKQLRYEDKFLLHQKISITKLAEEMGISKATISNLEASDDYDAKISIIKKYKEHFPEVSYDYLLGATATKQKQYNRIEEELPFSNAFYNSLQKMCEDESNKQIIEFMLEALFANPDALASLLLSTFHAFEELHRYTNHEFYAYEYMSTEDDIQLKAREYIISNTFIEFFKANVIPKLGVIFEERYHKFNKKAQEFLLFTDSPPDIAPFE